MISQWNPLPKETSRKLRKKCMKSFNEMTSALQDVALCDTMPRLFAAVRDKFPELMDVQDITLYVADRNENGEEVLYSEAVEARYDVARHLHALFVSCCTSASSSKRESSRSRRRRKKCPQY